MTRRLHVCILLLAGLVAGCSSLPPLVDAPVDLGPGPLNETTAAAGLREALAIGADRAAARLSAQDGYIGDPDLRIRLPEPWLRPAKLMRDVGLGSYVDDIELTMNRAAELAAREAAPVFADAVAAMTLKDALGILHGDDTAATAYFRGHTEKELRVRYEPIVSARMDEVGVLRAWDKAVERYERLPVRVNVEPVDLTAHVVDGALDGLFTALGQEERRIRQDPLARTTALLRRVFGAS